MDWKESLSLLAEVSKAMHMSMELEKRFYIILTCVTAGCALGFSRAILLLVNEKKGILEGVMGVGPTSQEDATIIWQEMSRQKKSLEDLVNEYDKLPEKENMPLYSLVKNLNIPLDKTSDLLIASLREKKIFKISNTFQDSGVESDLLHILGAKEFVCVPLVAKEKAVGVLIADNLYSGRSIAEEEIQFLTMFASQIGLAIEEAHLHQQLKEKIESLEENHRKLREMERDLNYAQVLASVGEMAAYLAHEIRSPLTIMGGLAQSIYKKTEEEKLKSDAKVINDEVTRLERLLSETLEFVQKEEKLCLELKDINEVLEEVCLLGQECFRERGVILHQYFASLPPLKIDVGQIKQMFFNIIENSLQSMPNGGELHIKTLREGDFVKIQITDTGTGIPSSIKMKIFSPFFTTKSKATGLGLSIAQRIIERHRGRIDIESEEGKGTQLSLYLPY